MSRVRLPSAGLLAALVILLPLALQACSSDSWPAGPQGGLVDVRIEHGVYHPGDVVRVRVRNVSGEDYPYSFCGTVLERDSADGWSVVFDPDGICQLDALNLEPGASVTSTFVLPEGLSEARYRLRLPILFTPDPRVYAKTNSFLVRAEGG